MTPITDPTALTTQQLQRELLALRDLFEARIGSTEKIETRLQLAIDDLPNRVDLRVKHLRELDDERFRSIQMQFVERDTRTEQNSRDSNVSVDAALQAAKEAVGEQNKSSALAIAKSEASTTKQIDQLGVFITSAVSGLDSKINDIKERLTQLEGRGQGTESAHIAQRSTINLTITAIGVICAIVGLVAGFLMAVRK